MNVSPKTPSALKRRGIVIHRRHRTAMQRKACHPESMHALNLEDQIAAYRLRIGELERLVKLRDDTIAELRGAE